MAWQAWLWMLLWEAYSSYRSGFHFLNEIVSTIASQTWQILPQSVKLMIQKVQIIEKTCTCVEIYSILTKSYWYSPKVLLVLNKLVPTSETVTDFPNTVEIPCFKKTSNLNRNVICMYGG